MNLAILKQRPLLIASMFGAVLLFAQEPASVRVTGSVKQPTALTPEDLAKMPRSSVRAKMGDQEASYEGVWLHEILKRAGAPSGNDLRGKALATCVLVKAKDGYQVVFSLAELDPAFVDNEILLADTADGKPLAGDQGRFRLIAPKEQRSARSVRMVTEIEVLDLRK